MTWEEFKTNEFVGVNFATQILTDIECPECGKKIYYDSSIILTSYPPKYSYWCKCGWRDTSFAPWARR